MRLPVPMIPHALHTPAPWNMAGQMAQSLSGRLPVCVHGSGHVAKIPWSLALWYYKKLYPSLCGDDFSICPLAL